MSVITSLGRFDVHPEKSETTHNDSSYSEHVQKCIDLLLIHGKDKFGIVHTPLLVTILDIESRTCPEIPATLDEHFREIRWDRRSPAGSNLYTDQPTLKAMYALSDITGNIDYAAFANRYSIYVMKNPVDEQGFFWWGWHRHYDVFKDSWKGHNPSQAKWGKSVHPHDIHAIKGVTWDRLWVVDRCAVTNEIEAFAFMYTKTKDKQWLDRARLVADYFWKRRNPETNLLPERPNAGENRFEGVSFVTSATGLHCHSLLKAYEMTKEISFRDYAIAYLKSYAKPGFDKKSGMFWSALQIN